ncbi:MAG: MerR family transcriptional regulator [Actinobacteria bacterium]|nr:MerR family transcriptional regulator [Actinomycetota bacterium]
MVVSPDIAEEVSISVASAAASVGLTPATLRTWDRRYGLSPSIRTQGGHRRYNGADLARLQLAARLVDAGLPPAGAVAAVRDRSESQCREQLEPFERPTVPGTSGDEQLPEKLKQEVGRRPGGGRTLAMGPATAEQRGIARAAMALDGERVRELMVKAIAARGTIAAWNELALPTLIAIGDRWEQTGENIEVEHVASLAFQQALDGVQFPARSGRPVVLACAPGDSHALPMLALRAALLESGVNVVMLGADLPGSSLIAGVARLRPRAVVVWATLPSHGDESVLANLPQQRPSAKLYVAGRGWDGADVSAIQATALCSLEQAVEQLSP